MLQAMYKIKLLAITNKNSKHNSMPQILQLDNSCFIGQMSLFFKFNTEIELIFVTV